MTDLRIPDISRRGLLKATGLAAGLALVPGLAACAQSKTQTSSGGGTAGTLKFWDMPWAQDAYNTASAALVAAYKPAEGLPNAALQRIQWNNFTTTFSSALASKTGPGGQLGRWVPGVPVRRPGLHRHGRQPDLDVGEGRLRKRLPARARSRR